MQRLVKVVLGVSVQVLLKELDDCHVHVAVSAVALAVAAVSVVRGSARQVLGHSDAILLSLQVRAGVIVLAGSMAARVGVLGIVVVIV